MLLPNTQTLLGNQSLITTRTLIKIIKTAKRLKDTSHPIFHIVLGESGSGKSVIANHIMSVARLRPYAGNTTGIIGMSVNRPRN